MPTKDTLMFAFCTSLFTALFSWVGFALVAAFQRKNEGRRYFRERLIEYYSELVALASEDLDRAAKVRAGLELGQESDKYSAEDEARLNELEAKRHSIQLNLLRAAMKLRLFENNEALSKKAELLAKSQPFMTFPFPPKWGKGNYDERFDEYCNSISKYDALLMSMINDVRKSHTAHLA